MNAGGGDIKCVADGLDVGLILEQLAEIPTARAEEECFPYDPNDLKWRNVNEWTIGNRGKDGYALYDQYSIVLRYVTVALDHATQQLFLLEAKQDRDHWTKPAFHLLHGAKSVVFDLMRQVHGEHLGRVIISRLPPGGVIGVHIDKKPAIPGVRYWQRYQVPLQVDEGVVFNCEAESVHMVPGRAYWFDNSKPHSVHNGSDRDRISMVVEVRTLQPC